MVIFRLIGLVLLVLALMLLGADVVSTLEAKGMTVIRSLDGILALFGMDAHAWAAQRLTPALAPIFATILSWPGWAVLGVPGAILGMLAAPRRERYRLPPPIPPANQTGP